MNMALTSRAFQIALFLGCGYTFLISDCLEINAFNTLEDGVSFSPYSKAIFQCTINPYTGGQTWRVDSVSVADCGFILCVENTSNPERYSFTPNVSTGTFVFEIDPLLYADDGNVIECFDGSNTKNYTVVVAGISNSTCDPNDFETCIYLAALGESLHSIVSIQNLYQGFFLYSLLKRTGLNRSAKFIWLNFFAWIPLLGSLFFKGILDCCNEGKCHDCKKHSPAEGYCYNCKAYLCMKCFDGHTKPYRRHIKRQIQREYQCHECQKVCIPDDYCLNCKVYFCRHCLQSDQTTKGHLCSPPLIKSAKRDQEKHKCHGCGILTVVEHYCLIHGDFLCTTCFQSHSQSVQHCTHSILSEQGVKECNNCKETFDIKGHCLTCGAFLCQQCFEIHNIHPTRQIHKEVNYIEKTYKRLLVVACVPALSVVAVCFLWIKCWNKIRQQNLTFIFLAAFGCIVAIAHPLVVLKACLAACKCDILHGWYIALLIIKYIFLGWIPVTIVIVFIKLLEDSFYCDDCKSNSEVHGYCIKCKQYLCGRCVRKHENKSDSISKHSQEKDLKVGDVYFSCDNCKATKVDMLCCDCRRHLCAKCKGKHHNHNIVEQTHLNDSLILMRNIVCQKCPQRKRRPVECLNLEYCDFMCTSCFEKLSENSDRQSQSKRCNLCPDDKRRPVNVYCLVCKEYMCVTCFKWHRRLKQSWQELPLYTMLEENNTKYADASPKRSVPSSVVFRIIAGPILLVEIINFFKSWWCDNDEENPEDNRND